MQEYKVIYTFENCKFTQHSIVLRGKSAEDVKRIAEEELPRAYEGKPIVVLAVTLNDRVVG